MKGDIEEEIEWFQRLVSARNVENITVAALIVAVYVILGGQSDALMGRVSAFMVAGTALAAALAVGIVGKSRIDQGGDERSKRLSFRGELLRQAFFLRWFPVVAAPLVAALTFHAWRHSSILSTVLLVVIIVGQALNRVVAGKFQAQAQALEKSGRV